MGDQSALSGLRVVELARILAGPWIGQTLADLGADVIKVEAPEGDETRRWGPPFVAGVNGEQLDAAYFHCCNRGKRSVIVDFTSADDLRLMYRLIDRADILIENFRTGALTKFGLDWPAVHARNPRLVYCSVTGFGQDGPYKQRPGYDAIIQAMSGIMDVTGEATGDPQKTGVAIADILTGVYGTVGILAAVVARARTGQGQRIDMALLDTMVGVLANQALNYFVSGKVPRRIGSAHPNIVPYQVFTVADGHVMVAVGTDVQFAKLCDLLSAPELATDSRFDTNAQRVVNRGTLVAKLSEMFATLPRKQVLAQLEDAGIPVGPINNIDEVFQDPQVLSRRMRIEMATPWVQDGLLQGLRSPLNLSASPLTLERPAPLLGEHTDAVRRELEMES